MKKNIKVLHTEWSDGWGGQEIRIIDEIIAIKEEGIEVCLACREKAQIKNIALKNNIEVYTLPFKGNADFRTLMNLIKIIRKNSIDIVNTHSGKDTWVGGIAALLSGKKFIRTRHLSNPINSSKLNFINQMADFIITTGEDVRVNMIRNNRISSNKIQSIPTGINSTYFDPSKFDRKNCRTQLSLKDNEIVIAIVAVLRQFKRHDLFLKMAKGLIEKYPEKKFKFLIAGDGPQKKNIQKLIIDFNLSLAVDLLGHVDRVPELLSAIDILVLTSDSKEGVPQSVMQGLFMNKPVVATDCGSINDLFFQNNFKIVKPNDEKDLIRGVSFYLENVFEKNTRKHMINYFSKRSMVKKILQIYESLLR